MFLNSDFITKMISIGTKILFGNKIKILAVLCNRHRSDDVNRNHRQYFNAYKNSLSGKNVHVEGAVMDTFQWEFLILTITVRPIVLHTTWCIATIRNGQQEASAAAGAAIITT